MKVSLVDGKLKVLALPVMVDTRTLPDNSGVLYNVSVCSFNLRGFNFVKREYTRKLLSQCDVLFLQEHWLADSQLFELGSINKNFLYHGVCGFDSTQVLSGRPYGGCAILWRADWSARAEIVDSGSRRMCVVRLCTNNWKVLLINVYMPYEDNDERTDEFCELLSKIELIINENMDFHVILGGDFNTDFSRNWAHTNILNDFCDSVDIVPTIRNTCCHIDYTYNFNMHRFSTLDHFMVSGTLFDNALVNVTVMHDGDNLSDHDPIVMKLDLQSNVVNVAAKVYREKVAWYKASDVCLDEYRNYLSYQLSCLSLPVDALSCHDQMCANLDHSTAINSYANDIMNACITAANNSLPRTGPYNKEHRVPGWTEQVEPVRAKSILWHNIWSECGRPRSGAVADIMRRSRAQYHYAIRRVKSDVQNITRQRFAQAIVKDKNRNLWDEVRKIYGKKAAPSSAVDGSFSPQAISSLFADKYQQLYNCVSYNNAEMEKNQAATRRSYF